MSPIRKRLPWAEEIGYAKTICAALGLTIARSSHDYEVAIIKGDGVQLLIYPHKNTNSNVSLRIRDNGSEDKAKGRAVMIAIKSGHGLPEDTRWRVSHCNMFYAKNMPPEQTP